MPQVYELLTKYRVQDEYSRDVQSMARETALLERRTEAAKKKQKDLEEQTKKSAAGTKVFRNRMADLGKSLGEAGRASFIFGTGLGVWGTSIPKIAGAGAAAIAALGAHLIVAGIKANAEWEQLTVTLTSLTGSAELADKKLDFIRRLAIPATATTRELAKAGLTLEAFGLRIEKALPIAAKLQAAFQFDPNALEKAVSIMGRLAQGDFPDIEVMSGLGLSKQQFRERGIEFDPNGRLVSSARDALDGLAAIVESKYGHILEDVAETTNAKLATVEDRWDEALRKIGKATEGTVLVVLEQIATRLDALASDGTLERLAESFANTFKEVGTIIAHTTALVGILYAGLGYLARSAPMIAQGAALAIGGYYLGTGLQRQMDMVFGKGKIKTMVDTADMPDMKTEEGQKAFAQKLLGDLGLSIPTEPGKEAQKPDLTALGLSSMMGALQNLDTGGVPIDTTGEGWGKVTDPLQKISKGIDMIEQNTQPLKDLKRIAIGGGPLAEMGVPSVSIAGFRSGQRGIGSITVNAGNQKLNEALAELFQQLLMQAQRQGALGR